MGWLKRLAERFRWRAVGETGRAIPVLQVEVTSRCQLGCVYCPRTSPRILQEATKMANIASFLGKSSALISIVASDVSEVLGLT
ncbi:MAG: hypothetical protein AB1327_10780 [Bacillota bacterium]|uniref:hypothetical protein n=1 Tax=Desulforudis sp. DRI-14 TaxID=3459793 RepID=UPI00346DBEE7